MSRNTPTPPDQQERASPDDSTHSTPSGTPPIPLTPTTARTFGPLLGHAQRGPGLPEKHKPPPLRGFLVKRTTGLEPATFGLGSRRSTS